MLHIIGNSVLSAIYIEPPADVRRVPQNYTIHCITTGEIISSIIVGLFLERRSRAYYDKWNRPPPPVSGYIQTPPVVSTLNSSTLTHDYSEEVVWSADRVENLDTEFGTQGLSQYNGDHDWACAVDYPNHPPHFATLQTYIRGERHKLGCPLILVLINL